MPNKKIKKKDRKRQTFLFLRNSLEYFFPPLLCKVSDLTDINRTLEEAQEQNHRIKKKKKKICKGVSRISGVRMEAHIIWLHQITCFILSIQCSIMLKKNLGFQTNILRSSWKRYRQGSGN